MCGILGGNCKEWNYKKAIEKLHHRGPDGIKIETVSNLFTMAFSRLSIIDLSGNGMQPMTDSSGNVTITFNGEIYDYIVLKKKLCQRGYEFKSESDTEVLLYAYCEWGDNFVDHIDGMFAIAIFDRKLNCIKLFRDRAGIKPLYWFYNGKDFAYASELKGIETLISNYQFSVDKTALYDYYNYLYIPEPKTIYKNVYKLEAAHKLVFDLNKNKVICNEEYWHLYVNGMEGSSAPSEDEIYQTKYLIKEAVRAQIVADVPVGGFLSGGIDSSIITLEASKINPSYKTYAIGFYDFETNELPYVECLEKHTGIKVNKFLVKKNDFKKIYINMKDWFDEPFADTSAYPTYIVSKYTKNNCVVALSGDGGDEVFGGYSRYAEYCKLVEEKEMTQEEEFEFIWDIHTYNPNFNRSEVRKNLGISKDYDDYWFYRKYYIEDLPPITRMQYMDYYTYLPCDILTKTDRVGMAVSLETRVPFLAKNVVEYAFSLSQSKRNFGGELKGILKNAYEGEIPRNLLYRKKWGFGIPANFFGYDVNPQEKLARDIYGA